MKFRVVAAFLAVVAALGSFAAAETDRPRVRWEAGPEPNTQVLVVETVAVAAIEARMNGADLEVVLTGQVIPDDGLPAGVLAVRQGTTTTLRVAQRAPSFRSVRMGGTTARIVLSTRPVVSTADATYTIGIGDMLNIAVYKNPDISGEFSVAPDGSINMPLIGATRAAGLSESQLSAELTRKLAESFLVDPQVAVSVKGYLSQFVYVTGAVTRSGRVAIRPGLTLRGALADAEAALTPGTTIELKRASGEISILDAAALDAAGVPLPRDGDVLTVLQSNFVSIYGEVRRPNRLALTPGMTLLQAIALAEGLTDWASKKKVQILRKGANGAEELMVNLNQVENHAIPDPPLRPEDVIIVGRRIL